MSSKIIIIATILLLIISFSVLFVIEAKNHDLDYKKSWSVVYFDNPGDNSIDFVIENHLGEKTEYNYEILKVICAGGLRFVGLFSLSLVCYHKV